MFWSFVAVHLLVIAVISNDSYPIDLKEIDYEDIYLVDKERKGRFIQVNQTTLLPNPIELIRAKKSSSQDTEKSIDGSAVNLDEKAEQPPTTSNAVKPPSPIHVQKPYKAEQPPTTSNAVKPPSPIHAQKPYKQEDFIGQNNSFCADSLFEPQTFGYPSFFEDQFAAGDHQAYIDNPMNCCNFEKFISAFTGNLPCIHEHIVPQENLFC